MSNISAGIGRGQMEVLAERVAQRRANYNFYVSALGNLPGISFLAEPEGYFSNRWLTCITVNPAFSGGITREQIRLHLEQFNIECRPLWKPMHLQPVFADAPYYGTNIAEQLFNDGLCLPSGSNLTAEQLTFVADKIKQMW
jgi:dTDP-4-amino-4,6-dideoxygalactose transaminase